MEDLKLYVPNELKVGLDERSDTYTKQLGFITYFDEKTQKLRKEKTWENWRDQKISPLTIENVPTEGFVVNKNVGGVRSSYYDYSRREKVRIYDPRGFEIEITFENLLYILDQCDSIKGKGLIGEFIYGFYNDSLTLVPVTSELYTESLENTALMNQNVLKEDLLVGRLYKTKDDRDMVYMGREKIFYNSYDWNQTIKTYHNFSYYYLFLENSKLHTLNDIKSLSYLVSDEEVPNIGDYYDRLKNNIFYPLKGEFIETPKTNVARKDAYDEISYDKTRRLLTAFEKVDDNNYYLNEALVNYDVDINKTRYYYTGGRMKNIEFIRKDLLTIDEGGKINIKKLSKKFYLVRSFSNLEEFNKELQKGIYIQLENHKNGRILKFNG